MNKNVASILVLAACVFASNAHAVVPDLIPIQGMLADDSGVPIDGSIDVTFAIYNVATDGTALWEETYNSSTSQLVVVDGFFTAYLGTHTDLDYSLLVDEEHLYVGMTVGSSELTPRIELGAVPFAMEAQYCRELGVLDEDDAEVLGGVLDELCPEGYYFRGFTDEGDAGLVPICDEDMSGADAGAVVQVGGSSSIDVTGTPTHPVLSVIFAGDGTDATAARSDHLHTWTEIQTKPTLFPPETHDHDWSDLTSSVPNGLDDGDDIDDSVQLSELNAGISTCDDDDILKYDATGGWDCDDDLQGLTACYQCDSTFVNVTGDNMSGLLVVDTSNWASIYAVSSTTSGYGIHGEASSTTGTNAGVYGISYSNTGHGVRGFAVSETGSPHGVHGEAVSSAGYGVYGTGPTDGTGIGVYGRGVLGVQGYSTAASGNGVQGTATGETAYGVWGEATHETGLNHGVHGQTTSPNGYGVWGSGPSDSTGRGVYGRGEVGVMGYSASGSGTGVWGEGGYIGVYGMSAGWAGWFAGDVNVTGGDVNVDQYTKTASLQLTNPGPLAAVMQTAPMIWHTPAGVDPPCNDETLHEIKIIVTEPAPEQLLSCLCYCGYGTGGVLDWQCACPEIMGGNPE